MTYENAPSTRMLATHCAACGRPLRDAASVEAGMGPDCRARYQDDGGAWLEQARPNWERAMMVLDGVVPVYAVNPTMTAHRACNVLVHLAACAPKAERGVHAAAIHALGFPVLAVAVAQAAVDVVEVRERATGGYAVHTPYSLLFVTGLKGARIGARWDAVAKVWTVPGDQRARAALFAVLRQTFAGALLVSAKGITRIAA